MACSASACYSNCYRDEEDDHEPEAPTPLTKTTIAEAEATPTANGNHHHGLCLKCKANRPISSTTSSSSSGFGDDAKFCIDCFRSNLFRKFRQALTSNAMISPTDKVLVAFSGGPSSRWRS